MKDQKITSEEMISKLEKLNKSDALCAARDALYAALYAARDALYAYVDAYDANKK